MLSKIAFYLLTAVAGLVMLGAGILHLTQNTEIMQTMRDLGYPRYVSYIVGVAEVCGAVILMLPRLIVGLKEFAYAGLTLLLLGALASHIVMKQSILFPALILIVMIASYFLRKRLQIAAQK